MNEASGVGGGGGLAEALEIHVVASTKRQKAQLQRPFMKSMRSHLKL
jgi:hypothetical protein